MGPTVSVLIKSFNHEPYVRQTIESVLAQSFQDFEIVATDDGSTDNTSGVLRSFADPRIKLRWLKQNRGISGAMNATIRRARGRYFAILNSDDWALPDRLARQVSFLDKHQDVALLFGQPRTVDDEGRPTLGFNDFGIPLRFPDFSRARWIRHFFFEGNCLCAPTAMIRREVYDNIGNYDRRLTNLQDYDVWIRAVCAGYNIHVLSDELTAFRIRANAGNMSAPRRDSRLRSLLETSKILWNFTRLSTADAIDAFGHLEHTGKLRGRAAVGRQIAELALRVSNPAYQSFGIDYLYRSARDDQDFHRLKDVSGEIDLFGTESLQEKQQELSSEQQNTRAAESQIAALESELGSSRHELQDTRKNLELRNAAAEERIRVLEADLASCRITLAQLREMFQSLDIEAHTARKALDLSTAYASELHEKMVRLARELNEMRQRVQELGAAERRLYQLAEERVRDAVALAETHFLSKALMHSHQAEADTVRNFSWPQRVYSLFTGQFFAQLRREGQIRFRMRLISDLGVFDAEWYAHNYPDVLRAVKTPLRHFCEFGFLEGRLPNRHAKGRDETLVG